MPSPITGSNAADHSHEQLAHLPTSWHQKSQDTDVRATLESRFVTPPCLAMIKPVVGACESHRAGLVAQTGSMDSDAGAEHHVWSRRWPQGQAARSGRGRCVASRRVLRAGVAAPKSSGLRQVVFHERAIGMGSRRILSPPRVKRLVRRKSGCTRPETRVRTRSRPAHRGLPVVMAPAHLGAVLRWHSVGGRPGVVHGRRSVRSGGGSFMMSPEDIDPALSAWPGPQHVRL